MEPALGKESEHDPDKISRFAVFKDKRKAATQEETSVYKNTTKSTETWLRTHFVFLIGACKYGCRVIKRKSFFVLETIRDCEPDFF